MQLGRAKSGRTELRHGRGDIPEREVKKMAHIIIVHLRFVEKLTGSLGSPFSNSTCATTGQRACFEARELQTHIERALVRVVLLALLDVLVLGVMRVVVHIVGELAHVRRVEVLLVGDVPWRYPWVDALGDRVLVDDADVLRLHIVRERDLF